MTRAIAIGERGYIDASNYGVGDMPVGSMVRFYFDESTYVDVEFNKDYNGKGCLQVRAMSHKVPSLSIVPSSGNTILIVPGG